MDRRRWDLDDRGDGRALLGCFGALALVALLVAGASAVPVILSVFFWKFAFPVLVLAAVVVAAMLLLGSSGDDEGSPS